MTAEIIVEFPSPLTEKEQRMICGYKGELIRCKYCKYWRMNTQFCTMFSGLCTVQRMQPDGYCSEAERKEE